ncbi:MAG: aminotransferase class V-fold PLP-dependent enzyme [Candidatus Dormibacteraeota bacterium]|uniref:Aminotransferase class V-fold PLP-dependent enzyme n=1 Tax=Candidatus Aeolococcus gillhamiae TaxID=3127015 RepID=A0A934N073_9BACT|nr:aminotransferase class V-fold PLP-dependent enzyme [Candidatus Dormibacteraeota bacterium]
MASTFPLEPTGREVEALTREVVEYLAAFVDGGKETPASDFDGVEALLARVRQPIPEAGLPLKDVIDLVAAATAKGHDTTGDGWLAYVPGGGLFSAALADFLARTTNRFVGTWEAAPVLAQIEATAVRWLCDLFGYPDGARGVLTTGGSLATFSAVVTARQALLGEDFLDGIVYVTSETHGAAAKAAALAGFRRSNVRVVPTDRDPRMDPERLTALINEDKQSGLRPCVVVATVGTTNTGAIDDIDAQADVAHRSKIWLHVDAAYGGFFQLTERGRHRFGGIDRADSIVLDPHKGMFLPYGTGALLVRDGVRLRQAHEVHGGPYLQDLAPEGGIPNFADYSPELSRDARGLRVWMPITLHGIAAFRRALDEKLDLAQYLYEQLRAIPQLEVPWRPELSIVCFRCASRHWSDPERATATLLGRINASRRVFLSSTLVEGRMTIRVCILSVHTHRDRIDELLGIIRAACAEPQPDRDRQEPRGLPEPEL